MELRVEVYEAHEHLDDVADVLRSSFRVYSWMRVTAQYMESIARGDPGVAEGYTVVGYVDGEPASLVQVVARLLYTPTGLAYVAGIANVGTKPRYRGRGFARRLLERAIEEAKRRGFDLAALFAGYDSIAYKLYHKLGFTLTSKPAYTICPIDALAAKASQSVTQQAPWQLIATLYEQYAAKTGMAYRSSRAWRWMLSSHPYYTWFTGEGEVLVEEGHGYIAYSPWSKTTLAGFKPSEEAIVREVVYDTQETLVRLLSSAAARLKEIGVKRMLVPLPPSRSLEQCSPMESDEVLMVLPLTPSSQQLVPLLQHTYPSLVDRW